MSSDEQSSKVTDARALLNNPSDALHTIENIAEHDPIIVRTFFEGITKIMGGISTLGAGFTFSFILNDVHPPSNAIFDADQVRFFLAISWFLFIVSLTVSSLVTLLLNFWGNDLVKYWNQHNGWALASCGASVLLGSALIAPFVFVCLVIMAFEESIGIAGIALAGIMWCVSFFAAIVRLRIDLADTKKVMRRSTGEVRLE